MNNHVLLALAVVVSSLAFARALAAKPRSAAPARRATVAGPRKS